MQARINLLIQSSGARCLIILIAAGAALMGGCRGAGEFRTREFVVGLATPTGAVGKSAHQQKKITVLLPYGLVIVKRHFVARRLLAFSNHVCNNVGEERETRPKYDLAAPRVRAGVLLKFQPGTSFAA